MKQKYEKPVFLAESFALSQTVAANCGWAVMEYTTQGSAVSCGYDAGYGILLTNNSGVCSIYLESTEDERLHDICYNSPDGALKLFNS